MPTTLHRISGGTLQCAELPAEIREKLKDADGPLVTLTDKKGKSIDVAIADIARLEERDWYGRAQFI